MSYIRAHSNPEGLYIWGGADKHVHISKGADDPLSLPVTVFDGLLHRFNRLFSRNQFDFDEDMLKFRGARLQQVQVGPDLLVRLSYNGIANGKIVQWECDMWLVTWMYISASNK